MNAHSGSARKCTWVLYAVAILGTFSIMYALAQFTIRRTAPPPLNQKRADERREKLTKYRAESADAMQGFAWIDQAKGLARMPIEHAMRLSVDRAVNPAAARSNLIERAEKANPAPPPAAPQQPSAFE